MADAEPRLSPRLAPGLLELDITDPDLFEPVSTSSTLDVVSELFPMDGHASLSCVSTTTSPEADECGADAQGDGPLLQPKSDEPPDSNDWFDSREDKK